MNDILIKTVQEISSLKYHFPNIEYNEKIWYEAENKVLDIFNNMYHTSGVVLVSDPNIYLNFKITSMNYYGETYKEKLESSYVFFIGLCAGLGLTME